MNRSKWVCAAAAVLAVHSASAATFSFVNMDGPGEGLNDATVFTPTGGNSATTLGAARLAVLTEAARIWGLQLTSAVNIVVEAKFDPLTCTPTSGTLGSAGPLTFFSNGAAPNIAYPAALADAVSGTNLGPAPGANDIVATFSSTVGSAGCLGGAQFYLGLNHAVAGSTIDLLNVVLHELGHGLGFLSAVQQDGTTAFGGSNPNLLTIFDQFVYSEAHSKFWPAMTAAERQASLISNGTLVWNSAAVNARTNLLTFGLSGGTHLKLYAPTTYSAGSSGSHWDTSAQWSPAGTTRSLLMEPFLTSNPQGLTDLTGCAFQDIGWLGTRCADQTGVGIAPVAVAQAVAATEDTAVQITILGTDADTPSLTYSIVTQPTRGVLTAPVSLVSSTGVTYTYTPTANLNGADSFVFQVTDGTNTPATATVTINVAAVNDAPVANAQTLSATGGTALAITLTGSDIEASPLTYVVLANPAHGTLSGAAPNVSYTGTKSYSGVDTFTFRVNDGALNSNIATVTLNVTAAPKSGGGSLDWIALLLLAAMLFARWASNRGYIPFEATPAAGKQLTDKLE